MAITGFKTIFVKLYIAIWNCMLAAFTGPCLLGSQCLNRPITGSWLDSMARNERFIELSIRGSPSEGPSYLSHISAVPR
jgi:hypothetical protein